MTHPTDQPRGARNHRLLFIIVSIIVLVGGGIVLFFVLRKTTSTDKNVVLLVGGYASTPKTWEEAGVTELFRKQGRSYGGVINAQMTSLPCGDFYTVQFADPVGSVDAHAQELRRIINLLRQQECAGTVTLVAFSKGGLDARAYLVEEFGRAQPHYVTKLLTVCTPHQASDLANILVGVDMLAPALLDVAQAYVGDMLPLKSEGMRDLVTGDNGTADKLNKSPHPTDICYVSITAKLIPKDWLETVGIEADSIEILDELLSGDGAVAAKSQNMSLLPCFKGQKAACMNVHEIEGTSHLNVLSDQKALIYQLTYK